MCELIRWGGGGFKTLCFKIGYSEPRAEKGLEPLDSHRLDSCSVGVYPLGAVVLDSDWLTTRVVYFCTILTT